MNALNRKTLRDLWGMKSQAVAIALVMACGVALFVLSRSLLISLELTQQTYYQRFHFAHVFATLTRAPDALTARIAEIPGVGRVQTRIVVKVNLSVPQLTEPASGLLISVPDIGKPALNQLYLRRGRWLNPGRDDEILASEAFADANQLHVGDQITAIINGRSKQLRIAGIALSPEYIYEISPGDFVPDNRHFGILWMNHEALSIAYNLEGAFNDLSLQLMRGAQVDAVIARVDDLIDKYGGLGAYPRKDQLSHQFVENEIESNRSMGMFAPTLFLGVSAFLIHVVMTRMISKQREQIAALKAFGYQNLEVGWHYLKLVFGIVAGGLAVGLPCGLWFGHEVTAMYAKLFHFPEFTYRTSFAVLSSATVVCLAAAVLGTLGAVRSAVSLPPAEAMRPEPPTGYGPTILERIGMRQFLPPIALMVLRQLERHPIKTLFSIIAIALAASVLVVGNFFEDTIDYMMEMQFERIQRADISVTTTEQVSDRAIYELGRLSGVRLCEPTRSVAVRLRAGPRQRRLAVQGIRPGSHLYQLLDTSGNCAAVPKDGLLVSRKLAEVLAVDVGDPVQVEVLEGKRPVRQTVIAGTLEDFVGLNATMSLEALEHLLREGPMVTGAHLMVDPQQQTALYRQLKETPQIASVSVKQYAIDSFHATVGENMMVMKSINMIFACVIAVGVVYNGARISLSERSRELATMRVLGFTRGEISSILLGELAVVTLVAIPIGLVVGHGLAWWMCQAFDLEFFRFPLVIRRGTYGMAALVVLGASIGSGLLVRRRLDRLDLVAVLKARE
jgi:putative ABC transport system permease protein